MSLLLDRILASLPADGSRIPLRALRCTLTGARPFEIDFALQGARATGRLFIDDGWISLTVTMRVLTPRAPAPRPVREWESIDHQLRELLRGAD